VERKNFTFLYYFGETYPMEHKENKNMIMENNMLSLNMYDVLEE